MRPNRATQIEHAQRPAYGQRSVLSSRIDDGEKKASLFNVLILTKIRARGSNDKKTLLILICNNPTTIANCHVTILMLFWIVRVCWWKMVTLPQLTDRSGPLWLSTPGIFSRSWVPEHKTSFQSKSKNFFAKEVTRRACDGFFRTTEPCSNPDRLQKIPHGRYAVPPPHWAKAVPSGVKYRL